MAKQFYIPSYFRSETIEGYRQQSKSKDLRFSEIELSNLTIRLSIHFGFCFGVKNALEIAYRAIAQNPGKRIFLLSEIIHNQAVNQDLLKHGARFIYNSKGEESFPISELAADDVVIVPAFGVSLELQEILRNSKIDTVSYDTTCPFVKKVWAKAAELGKTGFTVIIHGKDKHEETKATFSYSAQYAPTIIIRNQEEAIILANIIAGEIPIGEFKNIFGEASSKGFTPEVNLQKIGIVNQTTMLASDTKDIAEIIEKSLIAKYGFENIRDHFADTKDTLCYATYENQKATIDLCNSGADIALVVGGYNSSNTSHLVKICEDVLPTFYIKDKDEIVSDTLIRHFDLKTSTVKETLDWLRSSNHHEKPVIAITAGASCPDKLIEEVINRLSSITHSGA